MTYKNHENLKTPSASQILWRYTDFAKFTAFIQNNSLFFPSLVSLNDPWEGLPSKRNFDPDRVIKIHEACLATTDGSINEASSYKIRLDSLKNLFGERFDDHVKQQKQAAFKLRKTFFINCWHMNDDESDSQWKIYGSSPYSLAIVTSFTRLCDSITDMLDVYGSKVTYYTPNRDIIPEGNAFYPVIFKRQAFIHEREFRLIHWKPELLDSTTHPTGIPITVNLEKLIDRIVISPQAQPWFTNVVEKLIKNSGLSIPISESALLDSY
jgi:hypothetical protein